jgi:flagellar biosynthesis/type III secretory pathway ATPase
MTITVHADPAFGAGFSPAVESMLSRLDPTDRFATYGRVTRVVGLVLEATGLVVGLGSLCRITSHSRDRSVLAEVVGFTNAACCLPPRTGRAASGQSTSLVAPSASMSAPACLVGSGLGHPIDGRAGGRDQRVPLAAEPPNPLERETIDRPMETGVRAIDGLLTIAEASAGRAPGVGIRFA